MEEISIEVDGNVYQAYYEVIGDTLIVTLPDGSQRKTELRGLKAEHASMVHLRSYANKKY